MYDQWNDDLSMYGPMMYNGVIHNPVYHHRRDMQFVFTILGRYKSGPYRDEHFMYSFKCRVVPWRLLYAPVSACAAANAALIPHSRLRLPIHATVTMLRVFN